jgi:uroporphyrinogen decarboxylase
MNSAEKLEKMLRLEKPKDRSEIPYMPQIITWAGTCAGMTQKEIVLDVDKNIQALDITFEKIGKPDVMMCGSILDTTFIMGLPVRLPGVDLDDNALYQFVETDEFTESDGKEYDRILQMGWQAWNGQLMCKIQNPPFTSQEQLFARFGQMGNNMQKFAMHFIPQGIQPLTHSACAPIFDTLSQSHTMEEFCYDLYDYPEKVKEVIMASTPAVIGQTVGTIKQIHGTRAGIYAMRSSATFVSKDMFGEFVWPALKMMIEAFWAEGITTVLHADGNWLPMLEYFKQVPKGSVHFEFDGDTDMRKAYEILEGWQSMRGDVPAALLAYGTADEVSEYCENLIQDIGMRGGFMLGSGCEVPMNAKFECVKAMGDSLLK